MKKYYKKINCIILARGGSKGIPKKNIINFNGKPLISYSILQALESKYISKVFVSTDNEEISLVSKKYGANIIERPSHLSGDEATSEDALIHAVEKIEHEEESDIYVFLQATSPLRDVFDIDNAVEKIINENLDSVFSACELEDFLIWQDEKGCLKSINYDYKNRKRRQDCTEKFSVENGSRYVFKKTTLLQNKNRIGEKIGYSLMDLWKAFEIDSYSGLDLCSSLYSAKIKK